MNRTIQILSLLLLASCNTNLTTVYYNHGNTPTCSLRIPNGYKEWIISSGGPEKEHLYCYADSTVFFYISNSGYMFNANTPNIELLGDSIFEYRFQNRELCKSINDALGMEYYHILPDTFELSGMNADSLCWRDILIDNISIGYVNVRPELKAKYDQCLDTYSVKKEKRKQKKITE